MRSRSIRIRPATMADLNTIVQFNLEMARETEGIDLPLQKLRGGVTQVFQDSSKGFYIVAECDGKLMGQIMITYEWSDWRNGVFWWIQSVYVMQEHRNMGVFRSLFEHVKRMAEIASNVCGLRLYVHESNHLAKQAYENLGMEQSHYELYEMPLTFCH